MKIYLPRSLRNGFLLGIALSFAAVAVAWAGFTGPNRTTTREVRDPGGDQWYCDKAGYGRCTFNPGNPCPDEGGSHPSGSQQMSVCGWPSPGDSCGCSRSYRDETVSLPPATVGGSSSCASPGNNGWCLSGASLELSANEPVSGQVIQSIEGSPGGLLCDPADSASIACSYSGGGEGNFTIEFWAVSSLGDTSDKASSPWKVDNSPPSIDLNISGGTAGGGGWYRGGTLDVSVSGADAISGVSAAEVSVGGGGWTSSTQVSGDGVHSVSARVTDGAGNQSTESSEIRIDGSLPSVSSELSGLQGRNGWYVSPVTASASASDSLSGVAKVEVSDGSGGWQSGPLVFSADGTYQVNFRAEDVAGNVSTSGSTEVRIDATAPTVSAEISGTKGRNGWFISPVNVFATASDNVSGIAKVEVSIDQGAWHSAPQSISTDGVHEPRFRAEDNAGNSTTSDSEKVKIDTSPPSSAFVNPPEGSVTWVSGEIPLIGQSNDATSGLAELEMSFDEGQSWIPSEQTGGDWRSSWDSTEHADGTYVILARAMDVAGNLESTAKVTLRVDNTPPHVELAERWHAGEAGAMTVEVSGADLASVEVLIGKGDQSVASYVYSPGDLPTAILWDGRNTSGERVSPGEYSVVATAWDLVGNQGSDTGVVVVPEDEIVVIPADLGPGVAQVQSSSDSNAILLSAEGEITSGVDAEVVEIRAHPWIWPTIAWIGLLSAVGYARLSDPRTKALRELHDDISMIRNTLEG